MRLWRKKIKPFFFGRGKVLDNRIVRNKEVRIRKNKYVVFKCGKEVVVYERDKVVFNSVIENIPYNKWLEEKKRKLL